MRASHDASEYFAASGVIAQVFQKKTCDTVEKKIGPKNLAIEFLALEHPHKDKKIGQLDYGFKELRRLQRLIQGRARPIICQRIREGHSPEMTCRLAVTTSRGETSYPSDRVSDRQSRRECVAGGERRHVMFPDIPGGGSEGADQASRKYSSGLQCAYAKDLARMRRVDAPIVNDVEHLGSDDSKQDNQNPEVPCVLRIDSLSLGVAHADPQTDEHADRDQKAIRGHTEVTDMKKSGKH